MLRSPPKTPASPLYGSEPNLSSSTKKNECNENETENVSQRKRKRGDVAELERLEKMMLDMNTMLSDFVSKQEQQNIKIDSLHSALEDIRAQNSVISRQNAEISTQNDNIRDTIQFLSNKYDDAISEINHLQVECNNNHKVIKMLELKVDYLERNMKSATIEISNIPTSNTETRDSLTGLVQKLGIVINQPVPVSEIKNIFRMRGKKETVGTVIVEFTSPTLKEQFVRSTKTYNKLNSVNRLSTTHLQAKVPKKPIYISEALTTTAKRLHYLTREFIKSSAFEQCWVANGKIYVREKEGLPSRLIKSEEDLAKLRKQK